MKIKRIEHVGIVVKDVEKSRALWEGCFGIKLEAMAPQFSRLDPREPAANELRKLVAQELPELIEGYKRVPQAMRREERNGLLSPDKQLVEGLRVVDEELLRMSEQMASGDLDKLATQGRYLELKYRGEDGEAR